MKRKKVAESTSDPKSTTKSAPTTEASINAIWEKIEEWLKKNSPTLFERLKPGATNQELQEFEKKTGLTLPDDYKASLKRHNGEVSLTDYTYSPLHSVLSNWEMMSELDAKGKFNALEIEGTGAGKIQPVWWHKGWIPFAEDSGGNMLCIDTAPGKRGKSGQILYMELQTGPQVSKYKSFSEWLDRYKKDLRQGKYEVGEDGFLNEKM